MIDRVKYSCLFISVVISPYFFEGCPLPPHQKVNREMRELSERPWADPGEVIVEVNDRQITRGDFYGRILEKFGARILLSGVIKEELFFQEVERRGITVSGVDISKELDNRIALEAREAGGIDKLEAIYEQEGLRLEDVKMDYTKKIESELLIQKTIQSMRVIDERALREYYQKTYAKTRYHVRHILYMYRPGDQIPDDVVALKKQEALEKAYRAKARIAQGTDFGEVAREESEDPNTWRNGGDLGVIDADTHMVARIRNAVFSLKPGEVSDPVDFEEVGTVHLFEMKEVLNHKSFAESRQTLIEEMQTRKPEFEEIMQVLQRLKSEAKIKIFNQSAGDLYKVVENKEKEFLND